MTRTGRRLLTFLLPIALGLRAQDRRDAGDDQGRLPVKRVVLYKNGVGYFEHLGEVSGNQQVSIKFTSGQLNDVLKSLTVLDLNGGRITGVTYGSTATLDKRLGDLPLNFGEKATLAEFLGSLRGSRLEIRNGASTISGKLLSIERKTRSGGGTTLEVDYVSLITDSGEVKTTELSPQFSVRLLEKGLAGKVDRYLDTVASAREADIRRMEVSTAGTGARSLFVSYISEVPVWKTTYRIVLSARRKPVLQGWAIVDNTVGEDWEKVELSLVAGAPQSFIQKLSQPYYSRRPVVPLPEAVSTVPQTYESTLIQGGVQISGVVLDPSGAAVAGAQVRVLDHNGALAGQTVTGSNGRYQIGGLSAGAVRLEIESSGFYKSVLETTILPGRTNDNRIEMQVGSSTQTVTVNADARQVQTLNASAVRTAGGLGTGAALGGTFETRAMGLSSRTDRFTRADGPRPSQAEQLRGARDSAVSNATGQEIGDLFEYKLKEPVTILKNQSALVPIVQSPVAAEKISVWNPLMPHSRPQRALWLNNTSAVTLDGGTFSVLEEETFQGEGILEAIRPNEKRIVSYATDLALSAGSRLESESQRVSRVRIADGVLVQESEVRDKTTYTLRNEDSAARAVVIEHPVRPGYEVRGEAKPVETSRGYMRFRLPVESKQTAALTIEEARPVEARFVISQINADQVALFVRQKSITPAIEQELRNIMAQQQVVEDLSDEKAKREEEKERIFNDQQRLRENLKSLKGSAEEKALIQRYTQQLNQQEDRLEVLRKEIEQIQKREDAAGEQVKKMISRLSFDVKL